MVRSIRIAHPNLGPEVEDLVLSVLRSNRLTQGPMVERFEQLCSEMAGTDHAIAVANGTVALQAAISGSGIGPEDEVITTPFTFIATVNAILAAGARVRFVDIGKDLNLDPTAVADAISPHTRAVVVVHLYGLPADVPALTKLCDTNDVLLIEDASQAHGARIDGRAVGGFGTGTFSFYATKNVTAGEGGVITTSNPDLAQALRLMRNQGMSTRYNYESIGSNLRMTEVQAAMAIPQLLRLHESIQRRSANASRLATALSDIEGLVLPTVPEGRVHAWHQFTVLLPSDVDRDEIVRAMEDAQIEVGIYYPRLVWEHAPYRDNDFVIRGETPIALSASRRCLSLPIHPMLDQSDVERIASTFRDVLVRAR